MLWRIIGDVEILHGLVLISLHLITHVEHRGSAWSARHFPEINIENIALVWLDDALENAVALCHWLLFYHLYLFLLHIVAIGQYGTANQFGMGDD